MRIAYFDCFSGISGDMTLRALLHAGLDRGAWQAELSRLCVPGYELQIGPVIKEGISGMEVDVILHEADQGHGRHLADIEAILRGWVECAHGTMPVPAPATLELLVGFPLRPDDRPKELITPTGAALLAEYAERTPKGDIAPVPPMTVRAIGYGAGKRDSWIPNLLRVLIGDTWSAPMKTPSGTRRPGQ